MVRTEKGVKLMGMTTRNKYKVVNSELSKRKSRLCSKVNQQVKRLQYKARDLYAPVLKPAAWRLLAAIAAANKTYMSSTTQPKHSCTGTWWKTCTRAHRIGGLSSSLRPLPQAQEEYIRDETGSSCLASQMVNLVASMPPV